MRISIEAVKELRKRTNVGIADCNNALSEVGGDMEKAIELLKQRGAAIAEKKKGEAVTEGIIETYVHHTKRIGALLELNCETDFVARTAEFRELAHNLAMQIAATAPQFLTADQMPPEVEANPETVCLLDQPFIKDPARTVKDIIAEAIAKVGENIRVRRFVRFELGVNH